MLSANTGLEGGEHGQHAEECAWHIAALDLISQGLEDHLPDDLREIWGKEIDAVDYDPVVTELEHFLQHSRAARK